MSKLLENKIEDLKDILGEIADANKTSLEVSESINILIDLVSTMPNLVESESKKFEKIVDDLKSKIDNIKTRKGDKGDSYILTEADKEEISMLVDVPVVEKIIEKTETIKELYAITTDTL